MDILEQKKNAFAHAKSILIKVGSAVLTNEQGLDLQIVNNIVEQLAKLSAKNLKITLVSSGAVACGRSAMQAKAVKLEGLSAKQALAAIGQSRLMHYYDQEFAKNNILSAQILLTRDDLRDRQRFLNARNTFAMLHSFGAIPIVNENDTVAVQELKFGDNDNLASLLINVIEADLFINLTSTAGVLAKNPLTLKDGEENYFLDCIEDIRQIDLDEMCGGKSSVGTGGMYSKLLSARRTAQLGVPTLVLPGKQENVILRALDLESVGTWIPAFEKHISRRKYWLAYHSEPSAKLYIDAGASAALKQGKSLLPGGIVELEGNFELGDLVYIYDENNLKLGVGLINYNQQEVKSIKGLKRFEVAAILGNAHYAEVIHSDNLLIDAAI